MGNVKPKKHLGQHFLKDPNTARKISALLPENSESEVLEIGPGTGALSSHLLDRFGRLTVVETDRESVEYLKEQFDNGELKIIESDFLKLEFQEHFRNPVRVIGNLPYNISSPIFFHLLENRKFVEYGVFMVQKEVAQRICASEGSKIYGILSVLMSAWFELSYEFSVSPNVFYPKPKVDSAVFSMVPVKDPPAIEFDTFRKVVKKAFGKRRKTLKNALELKTGNYPEAIEEYMGRRAESLSVAEFLNLAQHLNESAL